MCFSFQICCYFTYSHLKTWICAWYIFLFCTSVCYRSLPTLSPCTFMCGSSPPIDSVHCVCEGVSIFLTQVREEETTQINLSSGSWLCMHVRLCVCMRVFVCLCICLSASIVASVLSVSAPATGSSHLSRPLPFPVCQYKAWTSHAFTHSQNIAGAELNTSSRILSRSMPTAAGKRGRKMFCAVRCF